MIFLTLGSQKFQFNRLLKKVDELIDAGIIKDEVYAQIGESTYIPRRYTAVRFMDREKFKNVMDGCTTVITHGGTGVIINAVKKGKKVLAIPRLAKYGEHVDDHQIQLLKQFDELGIICACYDINELAKCYESLTNMTLRPYISNTKVLIDSIDSYILSLKD